MTRTQSQKPSDSPQKKKKTMEKELTIIQGWISTEHARELSGGIRIPRTLPTRYTLRYGLFQPYRHGVRHFSVPATWYDLGSRLHHEKHVSQQPTNVAINIYAHGQGIPPHIDALSCGPEIAILNLRGVGHLHWYGPEENQEEHSVLHPGDLLVMSGDRRYKWRHEVPPWTDIEPRISVVFRYQASASGTNSNPK
jgi:alkylated DNA repair dioxygenase AlkB